MHRDPLKSSGASGTVPLVSSGCCHRAPQTGASATDVCDSQFWRLEAQGAGRGGSRQDPLPGPQMTVMFPCRWGRESLVSSSSYKDTDPSVGPSPRPHLNPSTPRRPRPQTPSHWGLRLQREFVLGGGRDIQPKQMCIILRPDF